MGTSNLFASAMKTYQQLIPELISRRREGALDHRTDTAEPYGSIGQLLETMRPLPSRSILLGRCTDGLPFLMDLGDPQIGAILVGCDIGCGKTHQLQVMADSALQINSPREVQISVVTLNPDEWTFMLEDPQRKKYLQGVHAWYDSRTEKVIENLSNLADDRRCGRRMGADVLLLLDDLNFVEELSYEAQVDLHWLLEYGAQSGIWVVATINADQAGGFRYWIDTFRTRIVGRVPSTRKAEILAMREGVMANELEPGEFRVWTGRGWLSYTLPVLGR
jgi:hypothetical protein